MTMRERLARWKLWLGFGPRATLIDEEPAYLIAKGSGGELWSQDPVTYHGPGVWTDATGWTPWHPGPDGWSPQETDWFNRHMAPGSWPEHHSCARPYDWKRDGL